MKTSGRFEYLYSGRGWLGAALLAIGLSACADDATKMATPQKAPQVWRVAVTGANGADTAAITGPLSAALISSGVATSVVTDASPVDRILEAQVQSVRHQQTSVRQRNGKRHWVPGTATAIVAQEIVRDGRSPTMNVEKTFDVSVSVPPQKPVRVAKGSTATPVPAAPSAFDVFAKQSVDHLTPETSTPAPDASVATPASQPAAGTATNTP